MVKTKASSLMGSVWVELIATLLFTFISVGIVSSTGFVVNNAELYAPRLLVIALGNGFAYAVTVYLTSRVTTDAVGYLNPAITLALMVSNSSTKRYSWGSSRWPGLFRGIFLMLAQLLGSLLGALLAFVLVPSKPDSVSALGTPDFGYGANAGTATGIEVIGTFFLTWVVFAHECRAPLRTRSTSTALAVGLAFTVLQLFAFPFTGACFNPFKSMWLFIISLNMTWKILPFLFGPFLGSLLAVLVYLLGFTNSAVLTSKRN